MSLMAAIHARWAEKSVNALLPADRLYTGQTPPCTSSTVVYPYAVVQQTGSTKLTRGSGGRRTDDVAIQFRIRDKDHDRGNRLAAAIESQGDGFENDSFIVGFGRVLKVRIGNNVASQTDDGLWTFTIDAVFTYEAPAGG